MSSSVLGQQGGMFSQMYPPRHQGGNMGTRTFSRAHPLALGVVQIMIGLIVFSLGVVTIITSFSMGVYSGFFVWGAGFYIVAGSLTVAAGKSFNRCLMNTTLAFNVIASLVAVTGTSIYIADTILQYRYCIYYDCVYNTHETRGMSGVMAVFHLLEFIITIVVAVFVCKSTCNCCNQQQLQQPSVYIVPGNASMASQAPPSYPPAGLRTYTPAASPYKSNQPPPMTGVSGLVMENVYQY